MSKPFGGKVVVLQCDFKKILLVIPKGIRQDIMLSSINYSYMWTTCKVMILIKNI